MGSEPAARFVTASLHVDYLHPTPLGEILELRGQVTEHKGRKVVVDITLSVQGQVTAQGQVVAVHIPEHMFPAPE